MSIGLSDLLPPGHFIAKSLPEALFLISCTLVKVGTVELKHSGKERTWNGRVLLYTTDEASASI